MSVNPSPTVASVFFRFCPSHRPHDAIIVLGGGIDTRPFAAAEDYRNGLARRILTNVRPSRVETLGVLPSHAAANRAVLMKLGVPETDIETLGIAISTTYDEGQALRDWAFAPTPEV
jgi:hypothetical protein